MSPQELDEAVRMDWDVSGLSTDEGSMTDAIWDAMVWFQYR